MDLSKIETLKAKGSKKQCIRCKELFEKKSIGRVKINVKLSVGEKTYWICGECGKNLKLV